MMGNHLTVSLHLCSSKQGRGLFVYQSLAVVSWYVCVGGERSALYHKWIHWNTKPAGQQYTVTASNKYDLADITTVVTAETKCSCRRGMSFYPLV